jgi:hypothetical protein
MNVTLENINRDYIFCSQNCFDGQVNELRNNPKTDGVITPSLELIQKVSDFPKIWRVILKTNVIEFEML